MTPSAAAAARRWRRHDRNQSGLRSGEQRRREAPSSDDGGTTMSQLLHLGEVVSRNARLFPNKLGARDLARSMTYRQWNERSCRLANALLGLGLAKGDRVAILAYNCVEWLEIYVALAKAGLVAVPINFRLVGSEIRYIAADADARAFIVQDDLVDRVDEIRSDLAIAPDKYLHVGGKMTPPGYRCYEALIERASTSEPAVPVL